MEAAILVVILLAGALTEISGWILEFVMMTSLAYDSDGSCCTLLTSPHLLHGGHGTFSDRIKVQKNPDVADSNKIRFGEGKNER